MQSNTLYDITIEKGAEVLHVLPRALDCYRTTHFIKPFVCSITWLFATSWGIEFEVVTLFCSHSIQANYIEAHVNPKQY